MTTKEIKTTIVATINGVNILASTSDEQLVPIKPICELFGVAPNGQIEKLKNNPLYSSVDKLGLSTGSDGKQYEMYCLPVEYCFAWMLGINSANVKEEIREKLLEYQQECVQVLKEHFFGRHKLSISKSAELEVKKRKLLNKAEKSDDLKQYLEIEKGLKEERSSRAVSSRKAFEGALSMFTPNEMTGK